MLKKLVLISLVLALIPLSFVFAGGGVDKGEFFIGLVEPVLTGNSFQVDLTAAAKAEAEKLGVRLEAYAPSTWGDFEKQIGIIEDLITKEVDFVILNPGNPQAIVPGLEMLKKEGIRVINIDNLAAGTPGKDFLCYIGTHNLEAAEIGGEWIAEKIGYEGEVAIIEGEPGVVNGILRIEGANNAWKKYPKIKVVASLNGHWSEAGGKEVMESILVAHPNIKGVFCCSDNMAIGAGPVADTADHKIWIVGFDGSPEAKEAIHQGVFDMTIGQRPATMAKMSVNMAVEYLTAKRENKPLPVYEPDIDSGIDIITTENVEEYRGGWG